MVKNVYYQDKIGSNKIFSGLDSLAQVQQAEFSGIGFSDTLIDGLKLYVLSNKDNIKNSYNADISINSLENNSSMVIKAVYGEISILFTGDIEIQTEERLVKKYADFLKSYILKAAHHGSKSSSSEDFIETVSPQYAVIFAASGNRFGFPSKQVTQRLSKSKTFVTGENGAVIFYTDGKEIKEYRWK